MDSTRSSLGKTTDKVKNMFTKGDNTQMCLIIIIVVLILVVIWKFVF